MRITWKDGATTLATGGAIVLERAYFHDWTWPLVSNVRWALGGVALLGLITLILGFAFDRFTTGAWAAAAVLLGVIGTALTALGLYYADSDYLVLLMLAAFITWATSMLHHAGEPNLPHFRLQH